MSLNRKYAIGVTLAALTFAATAFGVSTYFSANNTFQRESAILTRTADDLERVYTDSRAHADAEIAYHQEVHRAELAETLETNILTANIMRVAEDLLASGRFVVAGIGDEPTRFVVDEDEIRMGVPLVAQDIWAGALELSGDLDASQNDVRAGSLSSGSGAFSITADGQGTFASGEFGSAAVRDDLVVEGNTNIEGQLTAGQLFVGRTVTTRDGEEVRELEFGYDPYTGMATLAIMGTISANDLLLDNQLTVRGEFVAERNARIDGDLSVGGNSTVRGNSFINGSSVVRGNSTTGTLEVVRDATIGRDLHVVRDGHFGRDVYVGRNLIVRNRLTVQEIDARNISASGTLAVGGVANLAGGAIVEDGLEVEGGIVADSLTVEGAANLYDLDVSGTADIEELNVRGSTTLGGTLTVNQHASFEDGLTVEGALSSDILTVSEALTVGATGVLTVDGAANLANLVVENDLQVGGTTYTGYLDVSEDAFFGGDVHIDGMLYVASLDVEEIDSESIRTDELTVEGPTTLDGTLTVIDVATFEDNVLIEEALAVGGPVVPGNALSVTGNSVFGGNLHILPTGTLMAGVLTATSTNVTIAATTGTSLIVLGEARLADDVTFEEDAIFERGITLEEGAGTVSFIIGPSGQGNSGQLGNGDFDVIVASPSTLMGAVVTWWVAGDEIHVSTSDPSLFGEEVEFNWIAVRTP